MATVNGDEKEELGERMRHMVTVRCFVKHADGEEGHKLLDEMQGCSVLYVDFDMD